jgi:RNA polymerase sigma-70 factor (ECF subfamily)
MTTDRGSRVAEEQLVEAARDGDAGAFELLVRAQIDRLYGAARTMLRDPELAEDAVQQALVRAWRDLRALRQTDRFGPWLQKLLVRACYDEARRRRRWSAGVRALPIADDTSLASVVADRELIERGLAAISADHRVVLTLHFYLELTPTEIGDRLGIPAGTARSRLHYALIALRAAVDATARPSGRATGSLA